MFICLLQDSLQNAIFMPKKLKTNRILFCYITQKISERQFSKQNKTKGHILGSALFCQNDKETFIHPFSPYVSTLFRQGLKQRVFNRRFQYEQH